MRNLSLMAIMAACLLSAPAWGAAPPAAEEHLVVAPYPGGAPWQVVTDQRNAEQYMIERIPADQSVTAISDIVVEQAFFRLQGANPSTFLNGLLHRLAASCRSVRINGPKADVQNGYSVAYGQSYCVDAGGEDVDSFIKVIGGKSALYVVQREFHRPTTPGAVAGVRSFGQDQIDQLRAMASAMKTAAEYTDKGVQLCPAVAGQNACPQ
jgi:hypothetical protein